MQATYVQRLRIKFSKTGPTRFIGHLDVARTWERALNRAKLPVTYSRGFNRRPKIQFATATPLGVTSEAELLDVWLDERLEPARAKQQIMSRMAPGLHVLELYEVALAGAALQTLTRTTCYQVALTADVLPYEMLQARVAALLAAEALIRERQIKRRLKQYDLRPLVVDLHLRPTAEGAAELQMWLKLEPAATGRPDEVLRQLGIDPLDIHLHRTALLLADEASA